MRVEDLPSLPGSSTKASGEGKEEILLQVFKFGQISFQTIVTLFPMDNSPWGSKNRFE